MWAGVDRRDVSADLVRSLETLVAHEFTFICRDLSDADEDGELNRHEFATALHLFQQGETGVPLPSHLWENGDNPHSSSTTGDTVSLPSF